MICKLVVLLWRYGYVEDLTQFIAAWPVEHRNRLVEVSGSHAGHAQKDIALDAIDEYLIHGLWTSDSHDSEPRAFSIDIV